MWVLMKQWIVLCVWCSSRSQKDSFCEFACVVLYYGALLWRNVNTSGAVLCFVLLSRIIRSRMRNEMTMSGESKNYSV